MTPSEDANADTMSSTKRLTKCVVGHIAVEISGELQCGFPEEVLRKISAAAYVTAFDDREAFTETLQGHKKDFASLLQHMAGCYKALFADVSQRAILDKYMELQLRWRQGLRKAHEFSYLKATEDAQVEEDQEYPSFSGLSDDWASLLLAHDVYEGDGLAELAKHSLLIIFQHLGTVVWDFMQASVVDKKVETGLVRDRKGQAINSEPISVEEDAHMLFRV